VADSTSAWDISRFSPNHTDQFKAALAFGTLSRGRLGDVLELEIFTGFNYSMPANRPWGLS
jgi:hypothetical protein